MIGTCVRKNGDLSRSHVYITTEVGPSSVATSILGTLLHLPLAWHISHKEFRSGNSDSRDHVSKLAVVTNGVGGTNATNLASVSSCKPTVPFVESITWSL